MRLGRAKEVMVTPAASIEANGGATEGGGGPKLGSVAPNRGSADCMRCCIGAAAGTAARPFVREGEIGTASGRALIGVELRGGGRPGGVPREAEFGMTTPGADGARETRTGRCCNAESGRAKEVPAMPPSV